MTGQIVARDDGRVHPGSGNVFADLGLPASAGDFIKASLAVRITRIVAEQGWSQTESAHVMGIDQPKVSALVRGRLTSFSAKRLFSFLIALDQDVEIVVKPKDTDRRQATMRVLIHDESALRAGK